jgi:hypothetical protein
MREVGKLTFWESVEDKGVRGGKVWAGCETLHYHRVCVL